MGKVYDEHGKFHPGINYHAEAFMNKEEIGPQLCYLCIEHGHDPECSICKKLNDPTVDLDKSFRDLQTKLANIFEKDDIDLNRSSFASFDTIFVMPIIFCVGLVLGFVLALMVTA